MLPRAAARAKLARLRQGLVAVVFGLFLFSALPLGGQQASAAPRLNYIRDAEIEYDLRAMMTPIMRVAGLDPDSVNFILVQDNAINAFVAGGMNVFVNTGLIQKTDNADQLIGVLAHELGHVSGGHLVRGTEAMRNASIETILGMVAGVAAGVLAQNSEAGMAAIGGMQELAKRNYFSFSRAQEGSADAAALRFLDQTGWSAQGFLAFMQKLETQDYLPNSRTTEYVRTHPLTQDRVAAVRNHVEPSAPKDRVLPSVYAAMHGRIKAKLLGFLQPENALLRTSENDTALTARYSRAIALYRTNKLESALALTDKLVAAEPKDPFFLELRGQMLYENGRIEEAVVAYRDAVRLLPGSALLQSALGNALLQSNTQTATRDAIKHLQESARIEPQAPATWRALATAWGRDSENKESRGMADYALAEEAMTSGNAKLAQQLADRALKNLSPQSPYRMRVQDIRLVKEPRE